jgi:hypothetical protein
MTKKEFADRILGTQKTYADKMVAVLKDFGFYNSGIEDRDSSEIIECCQSIGSQMEECADQLANIYNQYQDEEYLGPEEE